MGAVLDADFAKHGFDMHFYGRLSDMEILCDHFIGGPINKSLQNRCFSWREVKPWQRNSVLRKNVQFLTERPGVTDAVEKDCRYRIRYRLGLSDCKGLKPVNEKAMDYLDAHYSVSAAGHSRIISMGYRSPLPQAAFILANALLITYLEDQRAENAKIREQASTWLLDAGKKADAKIPAGSGLASATSDHNIYQDIYNKAADLERERRSLVNPGRLVSLAEFPTVPSFPKPMLMLGATLAAATVLAALVALRTDATDQTVRRTRDLEALTPVLASFPRIVNSYTDKSLSRSLLSKLRRLKLPATRASVSEAVSAKWETPIVAEQARGLYARLLLEADRMPRRCILVASAAAGEGKTFTTMAVAHAAVESGRRVLVIDCDLRRSAAAASRHHASSRHQGLAEILLGEIKPQEAAVKTDVQGLEIIKAGIARNDPAMLLAGGRLPDLISWAGQYDLILLDGPSGFPPDAGMIAQYTDGLLWCVRWGHTYVADVRADLADLHRRQIKLLGIAVTMVDHRDLRYYERNPRYWQGV